MTTPIQLINGTLYSAKYTGGQPLFTVPPVTQLGGKLWVRFSCALPGNLLMQATSVDGLTTGFQDLAPCEQGGDTSYGAVGGGLPVNQGYLRAAGHRFFEFPVAPNESIQFVFNPATGNQPTTVSILCLQLNG